MPDIRDQKVGDPISTAWMNKVASAVRAVFKIRGDRFIAATFNLTGISIRWIGPIPTDTKPHRFKIVSIQNDTVTCNRWDGTNAGDEDIVIAKPFKLQHEHPERHELITEMDTVDEQTVDVANGDDPPITETWGVTESYQIDDEIYASLLPVGFEVVDDIEWIDENVDGRAWAVVT